MKKILLIGNYPPPYGGVPHHLEQLSEGLSRKGHSVVVLSGGTKQVKCDHIKVYKLSSINKFLHLFLGVFYTLIRKQISFAMIRYNFRLFIRHLIFIGWCERYLLKNCIDVVLTYNILAYSPVGFYLKDVKQIPHVSNVFGEVYSNKKIEKLKYYLSEKLLNTELILSCSKHCGKSVKKLNQRLNYSHVQYGVDLNHFKFKDKKSSSGRLKVLFVGRISYEMGLNNIISIYNELIKQDVSICLSIVGGTGDMIDDAREFERKSNGYVCVLENVTYELLPAEYQKHDVTIVTSNGDRTCSSLALMESVACGTPVVATSVGGVSEISNNSSCVLVEDSVSAVTEQIAVFNDNRSLLDIMSSNCISNREFFSAATTNKKVENFITELLDELG